MAVLTWLGHATVLIETDGVRLLTDPVLRDHVGPLRRRGPVPPEALWRDPDAVLISHVHHDHLDLPSLRLLDPAVPVLVPAGAERLLRGHSDVRPVTAGDTCRVGPLVITAVPARHHAGRFGSRVGAAAVGYLVGRTWFAGDTGIFPGMAALAGRVDTALLPVGGWGLTLGPQHLDPLQACAAALLAGARAVLPIHWGTLVARGAWLLDGVTGGHRTRQPGRLFAEAAAQAGLEALLAGPGASVEIP